MGKKPSNTLPHSTIVSARLPDLGTLWAHDKHGLMLLTGIEPLGFTSFGQALYTFHVYRLKDDFHTEGIFAMCDWDAQFTLVSDVTH